MHLRNTCCGGILQKHDRKIMCNGALMVCLNSLVLANHKQTFIENKLNGSQLAKMKKSIPDMSLP